MAMQMECVSTANVLCLQARQGTAMLCLCLCVLQFKHAVYVQTCKLFADLERLRQEREMKDMHER